VEEYLRDLGGVVGVQGACVVDGEGKILASSLSADFPPHAVETVGRTFTRTLEALRVARRRKVQDADLLYENGRLVVKNLAEGCLIIHCAPGINVPLLNLTANVVARRLQEQMKAKAPPKEAPAEAEAPPTRPPAAPQAAPEPAVVAPPAAAPPAGAEVVGAALTKAETAALGLVEKARENKLTVRVMGVAAVRLRSPLAARQVPISGELSDLVELAVRGSQTRQIEQLLIAEGYIPNTRFNTLQGSQRMRFTNPQTGLFVELFIDAFVSYHELEFGQRLHLDERTLPLADLLLSHLLNVKAGEAELRLICCLFHDADLGGPGQPAAIDTSHVIGVCADDWGWYKTVTMNLARAEGAAAGVLSGDGLEAALKRIKRLLQMIEEAPKSLRWQVRARVGESRRWYEEPE
jgi:predicted regulator of Ras-like GTPase activity (Roadblock/LC7/MglB family)